MKKIIQVSDDIFWGFNIIVDLNDYKTIDELGNLLKSELIDFLRKHNLLNLLDRAKNIDFHQHLYTSYEELDRNDYDIIYFCGDCCR